MRLIATLLLCLALALPARAADPGLVRMAFAAAEAREEGETRSLLGRAGDDVTRDLILWRMARRGWGGFGELAELALRRPDWPLTRFVRIAAERAPDAGRDARLLARFFAASGPRTLTGARLLAASQSGAQAAQTLARAWTTLEAEDAERADFTAAHPEIARRGAALRLDEMLWRGERGEAAALLDLVDPGRRVLARARMALRGRARGVDGLIAAVPASLKGDPGLAYERFIWRHRAGDDRGAAEIALAQSGRLGRPELWGARRERLARTLFTNGAARLAYRVASEHGLTGGHQFAQNEWMAGWIALRGLNEPARAARHFENHYAATDTPISQGRGGYWTGRAYEAMGEPRAARNWYEKGARNPTSFYGQLAAEKIGRDPTSDLAARDGANRAAAGDLAEAIRALNAAGQRRDALLFAVAGAQAAPDRDALARLGRLALEIDRPDIAIRIAKAGARRGWVVMDYYYPTRPELSRGLAVGPAFAHAITRQESEMNPEAVSHAGARGLMQLMPATAKKVSRDLGVRYSWSGLTSDPAYNIQLGTGYLAQMRARWGNAPILIAASYNAGPHRAAQWIERFGDPRSGRRDVVDWIESIPFSETRNYVQRVVESLNVYRARLGQDQPRSYVRALTQL